VAPGNRTADEDRHPNQQMPMHAVSVWQAIVEDDASKACPRLWQTSDEKVAGRGELRDWSWSGSQSSPTSIKENVKKVASSCSHEARMFKCTDSRIW
jgi:hypothetical protein